MTETKGKCPECGSTDIADIAEGISQCSDCNHIAWDGDFDGGCPECKSKNIEQYAGDVSQCRSCNYIAGSDEFGED